MALHGPREGVADYSVATANEHAAAYLKAAAAGGGSRVPNVSANPVGAMETARRVGSIYGLVGAPGARLAEVADLAIVTDPPAALRTVRALSSPAPHATPHVRWTSGRVRSRGACVVAGR